MRKYYFIIYDGMFSRIEFRAKEYEGESDGFKSYREAKRHLVADLSSQINDLNRCLKDVRATKRSQVIKESSY